MTQENQEVSKPEETPVCLNCKKNVGTVRWVGEGGALAFSRGMWDWWCEKCSLEAQLEYQRRMVEQIKETEEALENVEVEEHPDPRSASNAPIVCPRCTWVYEKANKHSRKECDGHLRMRKELNALRELAGDSEE